MNLLFGHDQAVAEWVGKLNGKPFTVLNHAFGLVDREGHLRGGFVFTGHTGDCIELSLAGNGVASRGAMAAVLAYVFGQLKCSRLQVHTRRSNWRVREQLKRLGFHREGRFARRFYGSEHGICYSLTFDDLTAFRTRWRLA